MKNNNVNNNEIKESKELTLYYMEALAAVARESFLILDHDLRVVLANQVFYQNFRVTSEQTESKLIYDLGNGQWNIPELKRLLEEILPDKKVVKDYEVKHIFETIGEKTIVLNARRIDSSQLIILAMEDISARKELEEKLVEIAKEKEDVRCQLAITAEKLAVYTTGLEVKEGEQAVDLVKRVKELETLNKLMVGRELKMIELKKENTALKKSGAR